MLYLSKIVGADTVMFASQLAKFVKLNKNKSRHINFPAVFLGTSLVPFKAKIQ
jgi:hypothetical protein